MSMANPEVIEAYMEQNEKNIAKIDSRLASIEKTLRGSNGELGFVAQVLMVARELSESRKLFEKDMEALKAKIDVFMSSSVQDRLSIRRELQACQVLRDANKLETARQMNSFATTMALVEKAEKDKEQREKDFGSWAWFREKIDKYLGTVVTVILTALILHLLKMWGV